MRDETIIATAVRHPATGRIVSGGGLHSDLWMRLLPPELHHMGWDEWWAELVRPYGLRNVNRSEGFLTSRGRFVGRRAAFRIAQGSGQLLEPSHDPERCSETGQPSLISEGADYA